MGERRYGRRQFLRGTAASGLGLGLLPFGAWALPSVPEPRRVSLGRTGLQITDISFGSSALAGDEDLVHHALARGINYFDTAESYKGGAAEETLGRALRGKRDQVVLTSKTHAGARDSRDSMMEALEGSLRRLQTDHVDIYLLHAVNQLDRIRNPEWPEFVERARSQGKLRYSGLSGHGGQLVECLDYALDHDLADVMLVAYNFGQDPRFFERLVRKLDFVATQPELPRVLAKARAQGVGVVAMKTLRGGRLNDLRPFETGGATYAQAAFRWVLSGGLADALVVTMRTREQVDEYLAASGSAAPDTAALELLERYEVLNGSSQCRYGCSACESACPAGVPIPEVLRSRMYERDYEDRSLARSEYALLGAGAAACLACTSKPCAAACPHGIPIASLTEETHRSLGVRFRS